MDIIVVDGPNLYNVVGARLDGAATAGRLKAYFSAWFDLDRLILATVGASYDPSLGIVTFHSKRALGRGAYHLDVKETDLFWGRQGSNPNSSCVLVDIPGEQQETYAFKCDNCNHQQQQRSSSEKGVDTTITTYLLETSGRWQSVCIVSKDVDFVPPVLALRRHGKRVFCAVEESASVSALVRACQSSFPIDVGFLACDFALHEFLAPTGALDRIATVLSGEQPLRFRIRRVPHHHRQFLRNDRHIEIGIQHAGGSAEALRVRNLIEPELCGVPGLDALIEWDARNDEVLCLNLRGPDLLFEASIRHPGAYAGAAWLQWEGSIFDPPVGSP
jgi:hypothetical protein